MPRSERLGEQLRRRIRPVPAASQGAPEGRCELLEPLRARVFSIVFKHPGISGGGIRRVHGSHENPTWHLKVLRERSWIELAGGGWFPAGTPEGDIRKLLVTIQKTTNRRVLREVIARPGQTISALASQRGLSRSTIQRPLLRLRELGLTRIIRDGRGQRWYPLGELEPWDRRLTRAHRTALTRVIGRLDGTATPYSYQDRGPTGAEIRFGRAEGGDIKLGEPWSIEHLLALNVPGKND